MMTMPASLLGFGIFKTLSRHLTFPFSPVENVLVQSVAGGMAIMPLGCGFVGVVSSDGPNKKRIAILTRSIPTLDTGYGVYDELIRARSDKTKHVETHNLVSGSLLLWCRICCSVVSQRFFLVYSILAPNLN